MASVGGGATSGKRPGEFTDIDLTNTEHVKRYEQILTEVAQRRLLERGVSTHTSPLDESEKSDIESEASRIMQAEVQAQTKGVVRTKLARPTMKRASVGPPPSQSFDDRSSDSDLDDVSSDKPIAQLPTGTKARLKAAAPRPERKTVPQQSGEPASSSSSAASVPSNVAIKPSTAAAASPPSAPTSDVKQSVASATKPPNASTAAAAAPPNAASSVSQPSPASAAALASAASANAAASAFQTRAPPSTAAGTSTAAMPVVAASPPAGYVGEFVGASSTPKSRSIQKRKVPPKKPDEEASFSKEDITDSKKSPTKKLKPAPRLNVERTPVASPVASSPATAVAQTNISARNVTAAASPASSSSATVATLTPASTSTDADVLGELDAETEADYKAAEKEVKDSFALNQAKTKPVVPATVASNPATAVSPISPSVKVERPSDGGDKESESSSSSASAFGKAPAAGAGAGTAAFGSSDNGSGSSSPPASAAADVAVRGGGEGGGSRRSDDDCDELLKKQAEEFEAKWSVERKKLEDEKLVLISEVKLAESKAANFQRRMEECLKTNEKTFADLQSVRKDFDVFKARQEGEMEAVRQRVTSEMRAEMKKRIDDEVKRRADAVEELGTTKQAVSELRDRIRSLERDITTRNNLVEAKDAVILDRNTRISEMTAQLAACAVVQKSADEKSNIIGVQEAELARLRTQITAGTAELNAARALGAQLQGALDVKTRQYTAMVGYWNSLRGRLAQMIDLVRITFDQLDGWSRGIHDFLGNGAFPDSKTLVSDAERQAGLITLQIPFGVYDYVHTLTESSESRFAVTANELSELRRLTNALRAAMGGDTELKADTEPDALLAASLAGAADTAFSNARQNFENPEIKHTTQYFADLRDRSTDEWRTMFTEIKAREVQKLQERAATATITANARADAKYEEQIRQLEAELKRSRTGVDSEIQKLALKSVSLHNFAKRCLRYARSCKQAFQSVLESIRFNNGQMLKPLVDPDIVGNEEFLPVFGVRQTEVLQTLYTWVVLQFGRQYQQQLDQIKTNGATARQWNEYQRRMQLYEAALLPLVEEKVYSIYRKPSPASASASSPASSAVGGGGGGGGSGGVAGGSMDLKYDVQPTRVMPARPKLNSGEFIDLYTALRNIRINLTDIPADIKTLWNMISVNLVDDDFKRAIVRLGDETAEWRQFVERWNTDLLDSLESKFIQSEAEGWWMSAQANYMDIPLTEENEETLRKRLQTSEDKLNTMENKHLEVERKINERLVKQGLDLNDCKRKFSKLEDDLKKQAQITDTTRTWANQLQSILKDVRNSLSDVKIPPANAMGDAGPPAGDVARYTKAIRSSLEQLEAASSEPNMKDFKSVIDLEASQVALMSNRQALERIGVESKVRTQRLEMDNDENKRKVKEYKEKWEQITERYLALEKHDLFVTQLLREIRGPVTLFISQQKMTDENGKPITERNWYEEVTRFMGLGDIESLMNAASARDLSNTRTLYDKLKVNTDQALDKLKVQADECKENKNAKKEMEKALVQRDTAAALAMRVIQILFVEERLRGGLPNGAVEEAKRASLAASNITAAANTESAVYQSAFEQYTRFLIALRQEEVANRPIQSATVRGDSKSGIAEDIKQNGTPLSARLYPPISAELRAKVQTVIRGANGADAKKAESLRAEITRVMRGDLLDTFMKTMAVVVTSTSKLDAGYTVVLNGQMESMNKAIDQMFVSLRRMEEKFDRQVLRAINNLELIGEELQRRYLLRFMEPFTRTLIQYIARNSDQQVTASFERLANAQLLSATASPPASAVAAAAAAAVATTTTTTTAAATPVTAVTIRDELKASLNALYQSILDYALSVDPNVTFSDLREDLLQISELHGSDLMIREIRDSEFTTIKDALVKARSQGERLKACQTDQKTYLKNNAACEDLVNALHSAYDILVRQNQVPSDLIAGTTFADTKFLTKLLHTLFKAYTKGKGGAGSGSLGQIATQQQTLQVMYHGPQTPWDALYQFFMLVAGQSMKSILMFMNGEVLSASDRGEVDRGILASGSNSSSNISTATNQTDLLAASLSGPSPAGPAAAATPSEAKSAVRDISMFMNPNAPAQDTAATFEARLSVASQYARKRQREFDEHPELFENNLIHFLTPAGYSCLDLSVMLLRQTYPKVFRGVPTLLLLSSDVVRRNLSMLVAAEYGIESIQQVTREGVRPAAATSLNVNKKQQALEYLQTVRRLEGEGSGIPSRLTEENWKREYFTSPIAEGKLGFSFGGGATGISSGSGNGSSFGPPASFGTYTSITTTTTSNFLNGQPRKVPPGTLGAGSVYRYPNFGDDTATRI